MVKKNKGDQFDNTQVPNNPHQGPPWGTLRKWNWIRNVENFNHDENKNGFQIILGLDYGRLQDLSDPEVLARIGNRAVKTVNKPSSEYISSIIISISIIF